MRIAIPREVQPGERRVALVPESVKKLCKVGIQVSVEAGAGVRACFPDDEYRQAGALLTDDPQALLAGADLVLKVQPPGPRPDGGDEIDWLRPGSMLLSSLIPQRYAAALQRLAERRVSVFSTECIPRTTRAQSMDTLSSQANIAGYRSVLIAAMELPKYFPMLMTAAGTVFAAKVFVIGAGVAGLQAIATARRLGAAVEATDTRAVVKEQVESLGARFAGVESAEDAQDARGYARELSAEFQARQAELIARKCAASDVVITTALIGGVKAPRLITAEMVQAMKPGSVIVDLAAEAGGNCELSEPGETIVAHGVTICAPLNVPSGMPLHASLLWSRNVTAFVLEFFRDGRFQLNRDDEILRGALVAHEGQILHEGAIEALRKS